MTGSELYTLNTQLLGGNAMDETLFYQLLNNAKDIREKMRDWMRLRTEDTSIVFTASDTYLSTKSLPARFIRPYQFYDEYGCLAGPFLITAQGDKMPLKPIKFEQRYDYRNTEGYYYLDMKNNTIGRTGTTAGTLHLFFIQGSVDISALTTWALSDIGGVMLAYDVAIEQKGGIDWDRVNASQTPYNQRRIRQIEANMATDDARLQQNELGV